MNAGGPNEGKGSRHWATTGATLVVLMQDRGTFRICHRRPPWSICFDAMVHFISAIHQPHENDGLSHAGALP
jgi:hypothetical protein